MCLHPETEQPQTSLTQLNTHFFFFHSLWGHRKLFVFSSLLPNHHIKSGKKPLSLPLPSFPSEVLLYTRSKDPAQNPKKPGMWQNLASSVVVKALCLQKKWGREGFSTECKEWCHMGGGDAKVRHKSPCEWVWRDYSRTEKLLQRAVCVATWKRFHNSQEPERR